MPKRKSKFTEELQQKYSFFRKGRDEFEAECITCGYGSFVSVANKDKRSLDMHVGSSKRKNAVRFTFFAHWDNKFKKQTAVFALIIKI